MTDAWSTLRQEDNSPKMQLAVGGAFIYQEVGQHSLVNVHSWECPGTQGSTCIQQTPGGRLPCFITYGPLPRIPALSRHQLSKPFHKETLMKGMTTHSSILPGEFHGQRTLEGYIQVNGKESDMTERVTLTHTHTHTHTHTMQPGCLKSLVGFFLALA